MKFLIILIFLLPLTVSAKECQFLSHEDLGKEIYQELEKEKLSCKNQSVHLTFDDGPSPLTTPEILKELKLRNIKATFFITTTNLDSKQTNKSQENIELIKQEFRDGHLIADHGYEHKAYDLRMKDEHTPPLENGFSKTERKNQILKSIQLLNQASNGQFDKQGIKLFRFPYGRGDSPSRIEMKELIKTGRFETTEKDYPKQLQEYRKKSPALLSVLGEGFGHLGWNFDSHDSSYSSKMNDPKIIKEFILSKLKEICDSKKQPVVALFHDIKLMNTVSIPVMADVGKCLGLKFISANEMMKSDEALTQQGVLIPNPEEQFKKIIANSDEHFKTGIACENPEKNVLAKPEKRHGPFCKSEYPKKNMDPKDEEAYKYYDCEGDKSICFQATWFDHKDDLIKAICHREN